MSGTPTVDELLVRLAALESLVESLRAENAELRRRLGMDSRNSSKPPSTDSPFDKPVPRSLRRGSGRKPGGQPGHPGTTLRQVDDPDEVITHDPAECGGCGESLAGKPIRGVTRRQCFDIPEVTVRVTEHRLVERECPCGLTSRGAAPATVASPVQYGPRIAASTDSGIDQTALTEAINRYRCATQIGATTTAARSSTIEKKHHALAQRLIHREADYLRFTTHPDVPFDNNAAEREIRMIKLRQKVSGCLRTLTGAHQFAAIRSYLATAHKHNITFFQALTTLAEGQAWLPQTT